jgi:hypothetical protein
MAHAEPVASESRDPAETVAPPAAAPAIPPVPPAAFHAVSEHDAVAESASDAHRPVRRRRHDGSEVAEAAQAPLQLVETQAAPVAPSTEDELPRRTKPRRRRSGAAQEEPLQLVETQPGEETRDGTPAP